MVNAQPANGEAVTHDKPERGMSQDLADAMTDLRMRMNITIHLLDNLTENVAAARDIFPLISTIGAEDLAYQIYELSGATNKIEGLLTPKS